MRQTAVVDEVCGKHVLLNPWTSGKGRGAVNGLGGVMQGRNTYQCRKCVNLDTRIVEPSYF